MKLPPPRPWQIDAITSIHLASNRCILEAPTGTGKSLMILHFMVKNRVSTLIVVPTIALAKQWKKLIMDSLALTEEKVGLFYGEEKDIKPITLAVINSVRIYPDILNRFKCLVLDEIHRYGTPEVVALLKESKNPMKIGMTATLKRSDNQHLALIDAIGQVAYTYTPEKAIRDNVLNRFTVINKSVPLTLSEQIQYNSINSKIADGMKKFQNKFLALKQAADGGDWDARRTLMRYNQRKILCGKAERKITEALRIIQNHPTDKIIVFNEYIDTAHQIFTALSGTEKVGIFHSKNKDFNALEQFSKGHFRILVAVQSLNEGLDVRNANVGITVSSNSVARNTIQRLGRIIRKEEGKKAFFYQLYAHDTKEQENIKKISTLLALSAEDIRWE